MTKRAVLEIELKNPRPLSELKLIDTLDFGIFFGNVVRPDLLKRAGLKKGKNKQDAYEPADKHAFSCGHGFLLNCFFHLR
jgi:hypothetical protein